MSEARFFIRTQTQNDGNRNVGEWEGSLRLRPMKPSWSLFALLMFSGCPLYPDVVYDAGPSVDSGSDDTDAGPDAGTVMGNISAQLQTQNNPTAQNLFWSGTDVAFSQQNTATGQATVQGDSLAAGHLQLQLTGLVAGQTSGMAVLISYRTADGSETWNCSGTSGGCSAAVTVTAYDGTILTGNFAVQFGENLSGTDIAVLSNGQFAISFP